MKIAFIGQKGMPGIIGGVETHVEHLATHLVSAGHDVIVYTRKRYNTSPERKSYQGVELVSLPHIYTKYFDAISHTIVACFHVWRRRDVDVIHFQSIGPSLMIPLMKLLRPRTPIVATFHSQCYHHSKWGWFARQVLHAGEWMVCHIADDVITVSEVLREYVHMRYRRESFYIPNGVTRMTHKDASIITRDYGLKNDEYILIVSRMVHTKRFHDLIAAYRMMKTDKKLVIAWAHAQSDEYRERIMDMVSGDQNIITIDQDHQNPELMQEIFSNAALFVLPSDSEGLAIVLLEAMAYGRAVITSDIIENANVIKDFGITFPLGDASALAQTMTRLLGDRSARIAYGLSAQKHVQEVFNWSVIATATVSVYEHVTSGAAVDEYAHHVEAASAH